MAENKKGAGTPSITPVVDTGNLNNTATVTGRESLVSIPLPGEPQVKVLEGAEGLIKVNEIPQPGESQTLATEGVVTPSEQINERLTGLSQPPSVQIEQKESVSDTSNVIPFRAKAKEKDITAKVIEARIEVREEDRKKQMEEEGVAA